MVEVVLRDQLSSDWFVFLNRHSDWIKILSWKQDGFSIWYKRLEAGTFAVSVHEGDALALTGAQLALILSGVALRQTRP